MDTDEKKRLQAQANISGMMAFASIGLLFMFFFSYMAEPGKTIAITASSASALWFLYRYVSLKKKLRG